MCSEPECRDTFLESALTSSTFSGLLTFGLCGSNNSDNSNNNTNRNNLTFVNPFHSTIRFLSDGSLYIDNGKAVSVFESGFCIDRFIQKSTNTTAVAAYVCSTDTPVLNLTSKLKTNKVRFIFDC